MKAFSNQWLSTSTKTLCFFKEIKSYWFSDLIWWWINYDRTFIFRWTIPEQSIKTTSTTEVHRFQEQLLFKAINNLPSSEVTVGGLEVKWQKLIKNVGWRWFCVSMCAAVGSATIFLHHLCVCVCVCVFVYAHVVAFGWDLLLVESFVISTQMR